MSEELQIVIGGFVGLVIGSTIVVGVQWLRFYIWLRQFRKEYKAEREQWFKKHRECCELGDSYLAQPNG